MEDMERGLYLKYHITKAGTDEELSGPSFVLRPDRDPAAMAALYRYAAVTENRALADDIERWLDGMPEPEDEQDRRYREYKSLGGPLTRTAWEQVWRLHMQHIESDRISPYEGELLL